MTAHGVDRTGGSTGSATVPAVDSIVWNDVVFLDSSDSPYTVSNDDRGKLLAVDCSGGAVTINLPSIAALPNFPDQAWLIGIKKTEASGNAVTINRNGTDTIDEAETSKTLVSNNAGCTLVPDTDTSPDQWVTLDWGPSGANFTVDTFSGDASDTTFELSTAPGTENNTFVFISGVYQQKSEYSISGTTLTFSEAPPAGTNNVQVLIGSTLAIGVPSDATVTAAKLDVSAITGQTEDTSPATADSILTYDASAAALKKVTLSNAVNGAYRGTRVYTASDTWSKPTGLKRIRVTVVGGGGSGGANNATGTRGTGGGGGGLSIKTIEAASLGATETVTVGAGGAAVGGASNANAGGTSSFGAHCSATGGTAGLKATGTALVGASGGQGSGGDINLWGGSADTTQDTTNDPCRGGSAAMGFGDGGNNVGTAGKVYGGGGAAENHAGGSSGAGAAGIVIVEEFF